MALRTSRRRQRPGIRGLQRYLGVVEELAASNLTQDGIDTEVLARILVAATMVWSLWAPKLAGPGGDPAAQIQRFSRELKRLLLYGVMRPEHWPDLVKSLDDNPHAPIELGLAKK